MTRKIASLQRLIMFLMFGRNLCFPGICVFLASSACRSLVVTGDNDPHRVPVHSVGHLLV